jgi:lycopene beta-cyclase
MSYFAFHLVFIIPPILLLLVLRWKQQGSLVSIPGWRVGLSIPLIALMAFIYTTPWDNFLIWRGVWYYSPDRVAGTIGYVPIEEYLFFLLQCILTGLWLYWLLSAKHDSIKQEIPIGFSLPVLVLGTALSAAGFAMLQWDSTLYLGLILAWAGPILSLQWVIGMETLWVMRRFWLMGTLVPTLYLWAADRYAIGDGIWKISDAYTTGWNLAGLPIEEATFFLITNLLVVQGVLLFLLLKIPPNIAKFVGNLGSKTPSF